jgi:hypothetical protein
LGDHWDPYDDMELPDPHQAKPLGHNPAFCGCGLQVKHQLHTEPTA